MVPEAGLRGRAGDAMIAPCDGRGSRSIMASEDAGNGNAQLAAGDRPMSVGVAPGPRHEIRHHGDSREILVIFLINLLFNLLTLTLFRFWAKTRIRRYLWSHTSVQGEAFEYSGTGGEMFLGFVLALLVLSPIVFLPTLLQATRPETEQVRILGFQGALTILLYFFYAMAVYRAQRYRLSRSRWRGVRGTMTGSGAVYSLLNLFYLVLTWLTFGLFTPFADIKLWHYRLSHSWFGDKSFAFEGEGGALLPTLVVCGLLLVPTLGLSWAWYKAALLRHVASRTRLDDLGFAFDARGHHLLLLVIPNFLMMVFTLGLVYPYVLLRRVRFLCRHVVIVGAQNTSRIGRNTGPYPRYGEGMADFLGVGGL